jgi:hypothetical protein
MAEYSWPDKGPADVWDFSLDASPWLAAVNDTLASCSAAVTPAGLNAPNTAVTADGKAIVRLTGGSVGVRYQVALTLGTTGGRQLKRTVEILVRDR